MALETVNVNEAAQSNDTSQYGVFDSMMQLMQVLEEIDEQSEDIYDKQYKRIEKLYKSGAANIKELYEFQTKSAEALHNKQLKELEEKLESERKAKEEAAQNLAAEEKKIRLKEIQDEYDLRKKLGKQVIDAEEKERKKRAEKEKKEATKKAHDDLKNSVSGLFTNRDRQEAWSNFKETWAHKADETSGQTWARRMEALTSGLAELALKLNSKVDAISSNKSKIDTRLQGSKNSTNLAGSYWEKMSSDLVGIAGISPLIKQETVVQNLNSLVGQGIAFNVEQRATLQTIADKIATTFNAANGTLLRLVRVQQQDTTAARLGMESALTAFLNNMYETTEYMTDAANQVKSSLEDAMSLMTGENALSFEYQVQKWLGSMYSVGVSNSSVNSLSTMLGQIASGKIEGLTNGGSGNLIVMAANSAGLNLGDILKNGLNSDTTNQLLDAAVSYLSDIYSETKDNNVVQQQLASVYGMTAADLKAISNIGASRFSVRKNALSYKDAMNQLFGMADSMYSRTSTGEILSNLFSNIQYSLAAGIANNPALYGIYKMGSLLKQVTGGIDIPLPLVMGTGMNYKLNVADLMLTGALSGSILSSIGQLITGGGGGTNGQQILKALGVTGNNTVTRGTGGGLITSNRASVSSSGYAGNSSGSDIQNAVVGAGKDDANAAVAEAADTSDQITLNDVNTSVTNIYDLLKEITVGTKSLYVINTYNDRLLH